LGVEHNKGKQRSTLRNVVQSLGQGYIFVTTYTELYDSYNESHRDALFLKFI